MDYFRFKARCSTNRLIYAVRPLGKAHPFLRMEPSADAKPTYLIRLILAPSLTKKQHTSSGQRR